MYRTVERKSVPKYGDLSHISIRMCSEFTLRFGLRPQKEIIVADGNGYVCSLRYNLYTHKSHLSYMYEPCDLNRDISQIIGTTESITVLE